MPLVDVCDNLRHDYGLLHVGRPIYLAPYRQREFTAIFKIIDLGAAVNTRHTVL